jgi:TIR domain/Pentapeptide repeats (8 copies)
MANREHLDLLKQGVEVWNKWRKEYPDVRPDLSGADLFDADLRNVNLSDADLKDANLRGAYFSDADLSDANFMNAVLVGVYFSYADLSNADFSDANLMGASFNDANLSNTQLARANLSFVDLDGANLYSAKFHSVVLHRTVFAWVDLCTIEGLDTVIHQGPSIIDVKTVRFPEGTTRIHFLRGVGFSDAFIDYLPSFLTTTIQYASCFISYTHQDHAIAMRLYSDLQDKGVRCWFAPEDMKIGDKIRSRIDEAIHLQDKLLLLLSEHAIQSTWVEDEVEAALEKEQRQQREVLFPVRLDESVMQTTRAWAAKLRRTHHIGDFTHWTDPLAYQHAFKRLLHDLKAESDTKGELNGKPGAS